ncbi:hypothetical protein C0995_003685 [Termitomyces sp. Mi166|nr:hypothetical protein C0995_003685 [Termitomyces sp. Mi166\
MAAKFLCCLPLRLGVLVIAFIQFIITGATAAAVWWSLSLAKNAYKKRLIEQKQSKAMALKVNPVYAPVPGSEHAFSAPHANVPYAYGNGPHAFGNQGAQTV